MRFSPCAGDQPFHIQYDASEPDRWVLEVLRVPLEKAIAMKGTLVGLFSGIGGLERGFELEGFKTVGIAEIDPACSKVLADRVCEIPNLGDITKLDGLPSSDVLAAGFPCTPYSQAGRRDGLERGRTPLRHLLRLIKAAKPPVVVLENVAFIVYLHGGAAVARITNRLAGLGYSWAYRLVDTRAFGLPQRRLRWILVAARDFDAARALFGNEPTAGALTSSVSAHGFYWTEGSNGIGWAANSVPPLKGSSTIGIPSAPAIWDVGQGRIVTPDIRDAERLQGFPANWTYVKCAGRKHERARWRLVGNAVSVPVARWIAHNIASPALRTPAAETILRSDEMWPRAAFGWNTRRYHVNAYALGTKHKPILTFLRYDASPLSYGATRGFRQRYEKGALRKDTAFIAALRAHERHMRSASS